MHFTVSVLIPVHNARLYISRCLDSIIKQDYEHKQIVIIDDGSTDDSFEICQSYASKYPFVSVYTREHKGIVQTRKELIEYARGEYVLFIDSDDWIEDNMLGDLIRLIVDYDADIAMCGLRYGDRPIYPMSLNMNSKITEFDREETILSLLNYGGLMNSLCNKLIKETYYKGLRYQEDVSIGEDLYMMWQIIPKINKVVCTPALYYHYENITGSLTRRSETINLKTACNLWLILERESHIYLSEYTVLLKRRTFFEIASYSYLLVKQNTPSREVVRELIKSMKIRFPYFQFKSRLELLKILWCTIGIVGGPKLLKLASRLYNLLRKNYNH